MLFIETLHGHYLSCRQKLRRLEVAVMEYHETLEERGIRNPEEIEKKVASYRRRLQSEFGLLDSIEGSSRQSSRKLKHEIYFLPGDFLLVALMI